MLELPPLSADEPSSAIPDWDLNALVSRPCPVCNETLKTDIVIRLDKMCVSRCDSCGMIYLADLPSDDDIHRFYETYAQFKRIEARRLS